MLVRLASHMRGVSPRKTHYLVLGDDVVIYGKRTALKYLEILDSLGVSVSIQKSVLPSERNGLEFASKYISSEGNLRPLPIVLLTKNGLIPKFQFLTQVFDRILGEGVSEGPELKVLLNGVFGPRLARYLGDLFLQYYLMNKFCTLRVKELETGLLPELFQFSDKKRGISLGDDLSTVLETFHLQDC